ncbi:thioredoxin domain-containing protein [Fervidicella metallireducens]|uniref:thioredoxin domain-containing protein n=1 Tax=Fervidicella metallireducens TaxID=655338 RepID=UPI000AA1DF95
MKGKGENQNKLINEKSPYLLQHAYNPVDWYPWGDEAFQKAIAEDKPIFLSIGYATCHWCHVMAHESFEDEKVAELMNDAFVNIKVDREERPDIDAIYMTVCQMMTGRGGWPLTIIMTPDKKPFYGATYIPKESKFGRVGMLDLIPIIKEKWKKEKTKIVKSADDITESIKSFTPEGPGEDLNKDISDYAFNQFKSSFDEKYGGFGRAPKFPSPHNFMFLLRYYKRTKNKEAVEIVVKSLDEMRMGGYLIILDMAFIDIQRIDSGYYLILKRCYMIRQCF